MLERHADRRQHEPPLLEHLEATGVPILEGPYPFGETRALLVEDPNGLAYELIEAFD